MQSGTPSLTDPLRLLRQLNPTIEAAVLLAADGAVEAADTHTSLEDVLGPMLTTLATVGDRCGRELGRGALRRVVLEGSRGLLIAQDLPGGRLLAVLSGEEGHLGLLLDDVRAAAEQLDAQSSAA